MDHISIDATMPEVRKYLSANAILDCDVVINFIHPYFDLLAPPDYIQFKVEVMALLRAEYVSRFPYPSDVIRIDRELEKIAKMHGKFRISKNDRGPYQIETLLPSPKVLRPKLPAAAEGGTAIIEDELTYELKYIHDNQSADIPKTIDKYLELLKEVTNNTDYAIAQKSLKAFFEGNTTMPTKAVFVKHGNKKKLGYALGSLFREYVNTPISYEYLELCKRLFDCYVEMTIEENDVYKSNLYKYFTTK
jgi:hypothetical protein